MGQVKKLEVLHRDDLAGHLRHVAGEIDAGHLDGSSLVVILCDRTRHRDGELWCETITTEVFAWGEAFDNVDMAVGMMERAKRRAYGETECDY